MIQWFLDLSPPLQAAIVSALISGCVALLLGAIGPLAQRRIERLKGGLTAEIEGIKADLAADVERVKADLADEVSTKSARRSYEFDARKRLYAQMEPLLFKLFEASEGGYYRVASLVRTHRQGHLGFSEKSWLVRPHGYYYTSTIYRIFLPLAILRLIQRSTTFVDLGLDDGIRTKYFLLKWAYYVFTDDHVLAEIVPKKPYDPNAAGWEALRERAPDEYWRQGLVIGRLDNLIDAMSIIDGTERRPMTYGEFEKVALDKDNEEMQAILDPIRDMLAGFNFDRRPILSRAFLAYACLMRLLLYAYGHSTDINDLNKALSSFIASEEARNDLLWAEAAAAELSGPVLKYLTERIYWLSPDSYSMPAKAHPI